MSSSLVTFRFGMEGDDESEEFLARTADPHTIMAARRDLALPVNDRMHIHGKIERATVGENMQWSWKYIDSSWTFAVRSIDLCDRLPSFIEAHLDEWLGQCFCPWLAYVKDEVKTPQPDGALPPLTLGACAKAKIQECT